MNIARFSSFFSDAPKWEVSNFENGLRDEFFMDFGKLFLKVVVFCLERSFLPSICDQRPGQKKYTLEKKESP